MSGLDTSQALTDQASLQAGGDLAEDAVTSPDEVVPAGLVPSHALDTGRPDAAPDAQAAPDQPTG